MRGLPNLLDKRIASSVIPGIVVGAFVDDKKSGRWLGAQDFVGLSLEDAVAKAKGYPQLFD